MGSRDDCQWHTRQFNRGVDDAADDRHPPLHVVAVGIAFGELTSSKQHGTDDDQFDGEGYRQQLAVDPDPLPLLFGAAGSFRSSTTVG